eukprot:7243745-Alexandrium_andersonii.AAC.1
MDLVAAVGKAKCQLDMQAGKMAEIDELKRLIPEETAAASDVTQTPAGLSQVVGQVSSLVRLVELLLGCKEAAVGKDLEDGEKQLGEFCRQHPDLTPDIKKYSVWNSILLQGYSGIA